MALDYKIRKIGDGDLAKIRISFYFQDPDQWKQYYRENLLGERVTLLAIHNDQVVGYTNLVWQSDYEPFRSAGIPEINNMHILDQFQKQGIGTALLHTAENIAAQNGKTHIGIGVVMSEQYTVPQRLYPKLGYVPDGRGLHPTPWGDVLYLTKDISLSSERPAPCSVSTYSFFHGSWEPNRFSLRALLRSNVLISCK